MSYRTPQAHHIGVAEKGLYGFEELARQAIRKQAAAWAAVALERGWITSEQSKNFYTVLLPQAIFDLMQGFDTEACVAACRAFLARVDKEQKELVNE